MAEKTKEQMIEEMEVLRREIEAKDAVIQAREATILALESSPGAEGGYLVESPNPKYDGITCGVRFEAGRAFIPDSRDSQGTIAKQIQADFKYRVTHLSAEEVVALRAPEPAGKIGPDGMSEDMKVLAGGVQLLGSASAKK